MIRFVLRFIGLVSLALWEWFHKNPIIDVRLFQNLNFLSANAMMFGIVDRLLFRPYPYMRDPASVHRVYWQWWQRGSRNSRSASTRCSSGWWPAS